MNKFIKLLLKLALATSILVSTSLSQVKLDMNLDVASSNSVLPIPHHLQCNQPEYSGLTLGTCTGSTICSEGCGLVSQTSLLAANGVKVNGVTITPATLNTYLKNSGGYSNGCLINWSVACNIPGSTMSFVGTKSYSLSTIKAEIDSRDPVIAYVQIPQDHFIKIIGYNNNCTNASDVVVQDPLYSSLRNLSQYSVVNLRAFDNVLPDPSSTTGTFLINGFNLTNFIVWRKPPIPDYSVNLRINNLPVNDRYSIFLVKGNTIIETIMANEGASEVTFAFAIAVSNASIPDGSDYKFRVSKQGQTTALFESPTFSIRKLPTINVNLVNASPVRPGQTVTLQITFPESPLYVSGQFTVQPRKNGVPLANIGSFPVTQSSYDVVIPLDWNGVYVFGVSNSIPPSNVPLGYLYAFSQTFTVTPSTGVINESGMIPSEHRLDQNYPNPFNPATTIKFGIPKEGEGIVKLTVYDVSGKEITTLVNEKLNAGNYSVPLDMMNFSSGVYFYSLRTNAYQNTKRLILMK